MLWREIIRLEAKSGRSTGFQVVGAESNTAKEAEGDNKQDDILSCVVNKLTSATEQIAVLLQTGL